MKRKPRLFTAASGILLSVALGNAPALADCSSVQYSSGDSSGVVVTVINHGYGSTTIYYDSQDTDYTIVITDNNTTVITYTDNTSHTTYDDGSNGVSLQYNQTINNLINEYRQNPDYLNGSTSRTPVSHHNIAGMPVPGTAEKTPVSALSFRPSKVGDTANCSNNVTGHFDTTQYQVTNIYNGSAVQYVVAIPRDAMQNPLVSALSNQLQTLHDSNPSLFNLVLSAFSQTSSAAIQKAVAQLQPVANNAGGQTAAAASTQALGLIQSHNASVRTADSGETGAAAGSTPLGLTVWGQTFGAQNHQGDRDGIDGYSSRSWGFAAGADTAVLNHLRLGLSLAQAFSHVDDKGSRSGSGLRIHSTILSLYGNYEGKGWYDDSSLSYGWHGTDSTRLIAVPSSSQEIASASYTSGQAEAKTEVGIPLAVGPGLLTPLASLDYSHFYQPGYAETGSSADLSTSSQDEDSFRTGLGVAVSHALTTESGWEIKPGVKTVWLHEFNDKAPQQTFSFVTGGGSVTTTGAKPGLNHLDMGLSLDMDDHMGTRVSLKYDGDWAQSYWGNSGSLQVSIDF